MNTTMKKLTALLLAFVMLLSTAALVSCGDEEPTTDGGGNTPAKETVDTLAGKTPKELYDAALAQVSTLTNFEMVSEQIIYLPAYDISTNQSVISKVNGTDMYVKSTNDTTPDANMEVWYVGETYYGITQDVRFFAEITYDSLVEKYMPEGANADSALMNIPEAWLLNAKFVKESDSSYYIEFIVSGAEYLEYMNSTGLAAMVDGIENISYKIYFDGEGTLGDIITEFEMEVEGVAAEVKSVSAISAIGSTTITPPADTTGWQNLTGQL